MIKFFLTIIITTFLLCGCSKESKCEIINFTSWGSITEVEIINKIIKDFELKNPNTKVNFIHTPQNYFQKLHLLFASNTAPDVIFINNLYLPLYYNHLEDLTNIIDKSKYYGQAIECLSIDEKVFAIPRDLSNLVFYVNTDIIPIKKNWTIEDLLEIAKKYTYNNFYGISFEDDIYFTLPYLSYFGETFNENFDYKQSQGFRFYKDLRDKYQVAPTKSQIGSSTLAQMFLDKKIGMYLSGRWMFPIISEKANFNWSIIAFPQGLNEQICDSSGWAISKYSKNKDLAIKFIKHLSSEESAEYFTKSGLIIPARIEASKVLNNNSHNEKVFLEIIKYSKKAKIPKDYKKIVDKFNSTAFD